MFVSLFCSLQCDVHDLGAAGFFSRGGKIRGSGNDGLLVGSRVEPWWGSVDEAPRSRR